ncbi:hypothetical protein K2Z84_09585 [Candidatus Binatia bacterium]|jgi:hypothetical protein|nr:hypothetical protein [Candidatus Binatia bacterium]
MNPADAGRKADDGGWHGFRTRRAREFSMVQANSTMTAGPMTADALNARPGRTVDAVAERVLALGFLAALGVWMMLAG